MLRARILLGGATIVARNPCSYHNLTEIIKKYIVLYINNNYLAYYFKEITIISAFTFVLRQVGTVERLRTATSGFEWFELVAYIPCKIVTNRINLLLQFLNFI